MKKFFLILSFSLINFHVFCQEKDKNYIFNIELSDYKDAPKFERINNIMQYAGSNSFESAFFSNYIILDYYQTYPDSERTRTLNMFTFITKSSTFATNLLEQFSLKYLRVEDLTDFKVELASNYYPNDYGITSPIENLGIDANQNVLDYINAPKAWSFTKGSSSIKMGWSDAKIDNTDADFSSKVSFLQAYYDAGYHLLPFSSSMSGITSWHGTETAALGGAQGDNAHGVTGVCMDCKIVATAYGYGSPGSQLNPAPNFNNLLQLAKNGAKVINMSWASMNVNPNASYLTSYQWVVDELHDKRVVLVASAGNENSYSASYINNNYLVYGFPASLNHVISVTAVNHKNKNFTDEVTNETQGQVSWYVEDLITPTGQLNYNGTYYTPYWEGFTTNEKVDICAPGWVTFRYDQYLGLNQYLYTGSGTSSSSPFVTGTVGLMLSLNDCLSPDEVEDILQLTSKNIEANPYNFAFVGRSGSGKLETGDAVEFVSEATSTTGNALIEGQDFWRFDFSLNRVNNKLTISNQTFRDYCNADFTARNQIHILPGTRFSPNSGKVHLSINPNVDISCTPVVFSKNSDEISKNNENKNYDLNVTLYPNPNSGSFSIYNITSEYFESDKIKLEIFDLNGRILLLKDISKEEFLDCKIDASSMVSGVYIVKLSSLTKTKEIKFIKN